MDEIVFKSKNPWRWGRLPEPPSIERTLFQEAIDQVDKPQIQLVFGPRRVGKTTMLRELARRLVASGRSRPQDVYYFDLDTMDCHDVLETPRRLLDYCNAASPPSPAKLTYIMIDEIQRLKDPGLLLKALYDMELPIRVIATGSSSFGLRVHVRQSLVGRSRSMHLWPLAPPEVPMNTAFLEWGGFPEVITADVDADRQDYLANMWAAYIDREIGGFLRVEKIDRFRSFTDILASQAGQLVNLNELANTLQITWDTTARYLSYLEESFLVRVLRPFVGNKRGELSKMPKVFFTDLGILNLLLGHPGELIPASRGALCENAVEIILRGFPGEIYFWRTDRGAEVDFILKRGNELIPVEVKAGPLSAARITRGFRSFLKAYEPEMGIVVNVSLNRRETIEDTVVRFITLEGLVDVLSAVRTGQDIPD